MTLIWNREAEDEFIDAADYYEAQDDGLGERFIMYIQAAVARVFDNPFMASCFDGECRKVKAGKFPYLVIYYLEDERIHIVSVMHTSRRPDRWKSRLKSE